ncbi:hypothetical protein BA723_00810 [Helicobacter sp. CLO-3]|uniref:TolC family protein n=1 Tax=Helicobacter sp. CLO-3 TaxID=211 RepID=UPI000804C504|nr:TolC family protein [Helicobacter sp. CLO-3]OBV29170.1 hypothetical protein BA723_00810 [Helicobacter sp. CLO-3]
MSFLWRAVLLCAMSAGALNAALLPDLDSPKTDSFETNSFETDSATSESTPQNPAPAESTESAPATKQAEPTESTTPQPQESAALDIKSAWQKVLDSSEALKAQRLNTQRADKLSLGAKLSFLPEINASISYIHFGDTIEARLGRELSAQEQMALQAMQGTLQGQLLNGLFTSLNTPIRIANQDTMLGALNIIYPLYTGGARYHGAKIAAITAKDAKEAYRLKTLASFEELVGVYYGAVLSSEVLGVLEQIKESSALHYDNALQLQKGGQIARIEVLGAQVADDKAGNRIKEATNASEIAYLALQTALSQDITPISKLAISDKPLESEEHYVERALSAYPALKSLDLKIDSAKQGKKLAIAPFLPKVAGMGSYIFSDNQNTLLGNNLPTWFVGVSASISLITPSARIQRYQAAKITQLELESLRAQAQKDLALLVRKTYKEAVYARSEYASLASSVELAQENLKLQNQAFKQGLATSAQVVDAQSSLQSALIERQTSCYKAIVALAKLLALSDEIDKFYEYQK